MNIVFCIDTSDIEVPLLICLQCLLMMLMMNEHEDNGGGHSGESDSGQSRIMHN